MGPIPPAYFQPPQICYLQTIFMVHPPCKFPGGYFQNFHPPNFGNLKKPSPSPQVKLGKETMCLRCWCRWTSSAIICLLYKFHTKQNIHYHAMTGDKDSNIASKNFERFNNIHALEFPLYIFKGCVLGPVVRRRHMMFL